MGVVTLDDVLESAGRLQEVVPDAVLVGGSAAALWARHRTSFDHDHVLADLRERFDLVLEALESQEGWVTNRLRPGKLILGQLGDIETGVRQMIRRRPLFQWQLQRDLHGKGVRNTGLSARNSVADGKGIR